MKTRWFGLLLPRAGSPRWWASLVLLTLAWALAPQLSAQVTPAEGVITLARGQSFLLVHPVSVQRVSIGDPNIADAVVVSPHEVLVNGRALGSTTLIVWDQAGARHTFTVEVTVDVAALRRTIEQLFPGQNIRLTVSGNLVVITGTVTDARVARQALELARATGATVVDALQQPDPRQIMLQVRIAEVGRNVVREFNARLLTLNPHGLEGTGDITLETVADGLMRLLLVDPRASLEAVFRAMRTTGEVRTLAEPNLVAVEGSTASFLAGGEFPFPIVQQAGAGSAPSAISVQWREFGVRLNFTPTVTDAGGIRLRVAPEVSSLDFNTGLSVGGLTVPALRTRRAETEIELRDGQTFAIAGLLDNNTLESVTRLPLLGDLPVIGALFRSRSRRQNRTELLVLVTPRLVAPMDVPPPLPTGEVDTWRWDSHIGAVVQPAVPASGPTPR
jgi:pilus assembly protein CpaC